MGGGKKKKSKKSKTKLTGRDRLVSLGRAPKPLGTSPSAIRFKEREAKGLDGFTGMRKVTDAERKQGVTQLTQYRDAQRQWVSDQAAKRNAAYQAKKNKSDTQKQVDRDNALYGNTFPSGSISISEEGKKQAEENKAIKAAKSSTSDSNSLFGNYNAQIGGKLATTFADTFANPKFMYQGNMFGRPPGLSNYFTPDVGTGLPYTKGGMFRGIPFTGGDKTGSLTKFKVPPGAKLSRSPLGVRQFKLDPSQMKNLGMGVTDDAAKFAAKGLGKYGLRAIPFVGAIPSLVDAGVRLKDKDYTGSLLSVGSAIPGKIGWASLAGLAAHDINKSMNVGTETQTASTDAGGLNIGATNTESGTKSESNDLGRTLNIGDKVKVAGGLLKDIGTQALFGSSVADGTLTGNMDFAGNLPGDKGFSNKDVQIKGAFNAAMNSEGVQQLGEGLGLPKNFKDQLKDTASAGNQYFSGMTTDRDSIYSSVSDTLRDLTSNPKLGTTARFINQLTTDNPNVSDSERDKKVSIFGIDTPLTNENIADIRSAFDEKNQKFEGLSKEDRGFFEGGGGNRLVSGKLTDTLRGVLSGYKGDANIGLPKGEGVTLSNLIDAAPVLASNLRDKDSLASKRINEIQRLAPGGDITTPSLIKGQFPRFGFRGVGSGGTSINQVRSGGSLPSVAAALLQQQQQQPIEEIPLPTETADRPNLQDIQQQAYNQQMSIYGTPNYMAQFQPTQRVRPLRRRQYFNRDYFNQFV